MPTRTKTRKNTKHPTGLQTLELWRALRGLLLNKGPKNAVGWQRRSRKDRKIL